MTALSACTVGVGGVRPVVEIPTAPSNNIITSGTEGTLIRKGPYLLLHVRRGEREWYNLLIWPRGSRFKGAVIVPVIPGQIPRGFAVGEDVEVVGGSPDWPLLLPNFPGLNRWRAKCVARPFFVAGIKPDD